MDAADPDAPILLDADGTAWADIAIDEVAAAQLPALMPWTTDPLLRTTIWTTVRNGVMVGRTLFYGQTDGMLYKRSFDGVSFGDPVAVNPYIDPLWNTVETGSGPTGQTAGHVNTRTYAWNVTSG